MRCRRPDGRVEYAARPADGAAVGRGGGPVHRLGSLPGRHGEDAFAERCRTAGGGGAAGGLLRLRCRRRRLHARRCPLLLHLRGGEAVAGGGGGGAHAGGGGADGGGGGGRGGGVSGACAVRGGEAASADGRRPDVAPRVDRHPAAGRPARTLPGLRLHRAARDPLRAHPVPALGATQVALGRWAGGGGLAERGVWSGGGGGGRGPHHPHGRGEDAYHAGGQTQPTGGG